MRSLVFAATLVVTAGLSARADWPQFQGPNGDGSSPETGLLHTLNPADPKVLWSFPVREGYSGPAVHGGKVYLLDRIDDKLDVVRCIDLASGKEDWNSQYDAPGKVSHNGPRCTPAVDDKYVFVVSMFGRLTCLDKAGGKALWSKDLIAEFGGKLPMWAVAQSAILHKDTVIVAPQSERAGLVAFEKAGGKVAWSSPFIGEMKYCTPRLATIGGVEQVLMISASQVVGVEPGSGKVLWSFADWQCRNPIPQPVVIGDGRLFVTGGYDAGSVMIRVEKAGDAFRASLVFRNAELGSQMHNPILYQGHLYFSGNTNSAKDGLVCMDLDGKVKWKTGTSPPMDRGSIILADGVLCVMAGGTLRVVQPDPAGYRELSAVAGVLSGKELWAPMAISDGKLLVRDPSKLKCLDVKKR